MGRLVCFTDSEGQSGTCLREDEDCFNCKDAQRMIQGVHSGELSYAAAMLIVRQQERDEKIIVDFIRWVWDELQWQGVIPPGFKSHVFNPDGASAIVKRFFNARKRPAPRVGYKVNYGKAPFAWLEPTPYGLNDYVDFCYGFLSPACGFCELEPSVEHCIKCDIFLRQI